MLFGNIQLLKSINESSGWFDMCPWPEPYHRSCFYESVDSFPLLARQFIDCDPRAYGVYSSAFEILVDYLNGIKQSCMYHKALGPLLFNIIINDLFLFIEKCTLYNYADDNSVSHSSSTLQNVFSNLLIDCRIAVDWFSNNGMKTNHNTFQFMILSQKPADDIELKLDKNTTLRSAKSV